MGYEYIPILLNGRKIGRIRSNRIVREKAEFTSHQFKKFPVIYSDYAYEIIFQLCRKVNGYNITKDGKIQIDCTGNNLGYIVIVDGEKPYIEEQFDKFYPQVSIYHATKWLHRKDARRIARASGGRAVSYKKHLKLYNCS